MEVLIWNCKECGEAVAPEELASDERDEWQYHGIAILPDNRIISGKPNMSGLWGNETIYSSPGEGPEVYHEFCYRLAKSPTIYTAASSSSPIKDWQSGLENSVLVNEIKRFVYEAMASKEPDEESSSLVRINGRGNQLEAYSLLKEIIEKVCLFELFRPGQVNRVQIEMARFFAETYRAGSSGASVSIEGKSQDFRDISSTFTRKAEVLESALRRIEEIEGEVEILAHRINEEVLTDKEDRGEAYKEYLQSKLKDPGWMVQVVSGGSLEPSFVYTMGLYKNFKHPELIVLGTSDGMLLNYLAGKVKSGERLEVGRIYEATDQDKCHTYIKVENRHYHDYVWRAFEDLYKGLNFPLIQRITADDHGLFPWDESCDPKFKLLQPVLGNIPKFSSD